MKLTQALEEWINEKRSNGDWNATTAKAITLWARLFACFFKQCYRIDTVEKISRKHLILYRRERLRFKKPCSQQSEEHRLFSFFNWCIHTGLVLFSPLAGWKRIGSVGPADRVLSVEQIQTILNAIDTTTVYRLRNRTIIETLYATGIRRTELRNLDIDDVDIAAGLLWIHHGKGDKGRIVPITKSALSWLRRYLKETRPQLIRDMSCRALFISKGGGRMGEGYLSGLSKKLREITGIRPISAHVMRHSCATHLMEAGVPLPYIQVFLGHSNIRSTEFYLHVTAIELKEKYNLAHPREKWK